MKKTVQKGFTLIELVVVIVILGILAAIAIPRFSDLAAEARSAVAQGGCGALHSSAVLLYASNKAASPYASITANVTVSGMTLGGSCATPQVTPQGGTAVTCAAIPTVLCI